MIRYTPETARDAGLLREYIASNYGSTLTHGGPTSSWQSARRLCASLSRLTGIPVSDVQAQIRADYAQIEE
jgi:hypothetical protein